MFLVDFKGKRAMHVPIWRDLLLGMLELYLGKLRLILPMNWQALGISITRYSKTLS